MIASYISVLQPLDRASHQLTSGYGIAPEMDSLYEICVQYRENCWVHFNYSFCFSGLINPI